MKLTGVTESDGVLKHFGQSDYSECQVINLVHLKGEDGGVLCIVTFGNGLCMDSFVHTCTYTCNMPCVENIFSVFE